MIAAFTLMRKLCNVLTKSNLTEEMILEMILRDIDTVRHCTRDIPRVTVPVYTSRDLQHYALILYIVRYTD
jgi:hypothetical protein